MACKYYDKSKGGADHVHCDFVRSSVSKEFRKFCQNDGEGCPYLGSDEALEPIDKGVEGYEIRIDDEEETTEETDMVPKEETSGDKESFWEKLSDIFLDIGLWFSVDCPDWLKYTIIGGGVALMLAAVIWIGVTFNWIGPKISVSVPEAVDTGNMSLYSVHIDTEKDFKVYRAKFRGKNTCKLSTKTGPIEVYLDNGGVSAWLSSESLGGLEHKKLTDFSYEDVKAQMVRTVIVKLQNLSEEALTGVTMTVTDSVGNVLQWVAMEPGVYAVLLPVDAGQETLLFEVAGYKRVFTEVDMTEPLVRLQVTLEGSGNP